MVIEMLKNTPGSPDGIAVKQYKARERFTVSQDITVSLANAFITMKAARIVRELIVETKQEAVPENKEIKASPSSKKILVENAIKELSGDGVPVETGRGRFTKKGRSRK
jgi:hypothetical protein